MAVIEGIGMHFHEKREYVQSEINLSCPCPVEYKGEGNPKDEPAGLENALKGHTAVLPPEEAVAPPI